MDTGRRPPGPALKRALARLGLHVGRYRNTLPGARAALLREQRVELVIDVGAHFGEYGAAIRESDYDGEILSFEPVAHHFQRLLEVSRGDSGWECQNRAAGAAAATETIHISANEGFSSSLLPMTAAHEEAALGSQFDAEEAIEVIALDEALAHRIEAGSSCYLKADTQGYEHEVIAGAQKTLSRCVGVELELSLTPIYDGQLLLGEMIELMRGHGFRATHLEPEFVDPRSGELLCVNGLFQPLKGATAWPNGKH